MKSNLILKSTLGLSILLVIIIYIKYCIPNIPAGFQALGCLVSVIILTVTILFIDKLKFIWFNILQNKDVEIGLYIGLLWSVEIGINNFARPGLPLRDIVDNIFWGLVAFLIFLTSIFNAKQTKEISQGVKSGFWSGLASGAVACLTALLLIVFGMNLILLDPLNIKEWSEMKSNTNLSSMPVYFAFQTIAGAIMHLIILGALMGIILGFIGGIIWKTFNILRN